MIACPRALHGTPFAFGKLKDTDQTNGQDYSIVKFPESNGIAQERKYKWGRTIASLGTPYIPQAGLDKLSATA